MLGLNGKIDKLSDGDYHYNQRSMGKLKASIESIRGEKTNERSAKVTFFV